MGKVAYHIEKGIGNAGGLGHHIDRTEGKEFSYKDADLTRLHLNKNYALNAYCKMPLEKAIEERIKEGYKSTRKIRENTIRYTSHILSSDEKTMKDIFAKGQGEEWVKANLAFLKEQYGAENIVRFALHMDETTPHLHAIIIPLTKDGRLSAKEVIGNRKDLQDKQTKYANYMKPFGIERGVLGSKATHENIQDYRRRINQAEALLNAPTTEIKSILGMVKVAEVKSMLEDNKALKSLIIESKAEGEKENAALKKEIHFSENNLQSLQVRNAFLITEVNREKERYNQLKGDYEKALYDNDYRKKVSIERLAIAEKNIKAEMKEISLKSDVTVSHIDDAIRLFAKNVNHKTIYLSIQNS